MKIKNALELRHSGYGSNESLISRICGMKPVLFGINVLMADSSMRFVTDAIEIETWKALATREVGEAISGEE